MSEAPRIVGSEARAQLGWTLAMALGGLGASCFFAGLPLYGWARVRLLRIQLAAAGVPVGGANAPAAAFYALALAVGVGVGLAGAAAGDSLAWPLGVALPLRAAGLFLALSLYAACLEPMARAPLLLLDERGPGSMREACVASITGRSAGLVPPPALVMALSLSPVLGVTALHSGRPLVTGLAVSLPWAGIWLSSVLRVREHSGASEAGAKSAPLRGLGALLLLAGVAAALVYLMALLPAPMRADARLEDRSSPLELPIEVGDEAVELRASEGGVMITRLDGGGAGRVRSRGERPIEEARVEALPDGKGYRIRVETERGVEVFEIDGRGVRLDDGPVDRVASRLGVVGALLFYLSLVAFAGLLRVPRRQVSPERAEASIPQAALGVALSGGLLVALVLQLLLAMI